MLERNIRINKLQNVIAIRKALSSRSGLAGLQGEHAGGRLAKTGKLVECISIDELLEETQVKAIDVLKMDIEGSEAEALSNQSFLSNLREAIIECHGKENESKVISILHQNGFTIREIHGLMVRFILNAMRHPLSLLHLETQAGWSGIRHLVARLRGRKGSRIAQDSQGTTIRLLHATRNGTFS
jgi:hypothetical protein